MMGILFLHNKTNISGGEQSLLNLIDNLDRGKFIPYLMIPNSGPLAEEAKRRNIEVAYCAIPKLIIRNIVALLKTASTIRDFCRRNSVHLIHSYTPRNNILSALVGRFFGIAVLWHERNIPWDREKDIAKRYSFLPKGIICNSKAVACRFANRRGIPPKVRVILNGIDLGKFFPGLPKKEIVETLQISGKPVVGLISNLGKRKMPEYLLDAAPFILGKCPETMFIIVGGEFGEEDSGRHDELVRKTEMLGIQGKIIFTGYVSNVSDFIRLFDVGAAVTEKEACSRGILEMMACGKPIVAYNTGGNPELIENNVTGKLVQFGNIQAFTDAVIELLNDESKRESMGRQARLRTECLFDVRVNARRTQEIYAELIRRRIS